MGGSFPHVVLNGPFVQNNVAVLYFGKQFIVKLDLFSICDAFINKSMMIPSIILPSDMKYLVL